MGYLRGSQATLEPSWKMTIA